MYLQKLETITKKYWVETMDIPDYLIQQIRDGKVVLFLGAGASIGSMPKNNGTLKRIPDARILTDLISDKFLGGEDKDRSLSVVADYAIDESDLITVQTYIRDVLLDFQPADFHKKIPEFKWAAVVTTNYDLILEDAYSAAKKPLQNLRPVIKSTDRIEEITREANSLIYLKLHGCISKYNDSSVPFILTIDQYETHQKNRVRLFERFRSFASDFTVIFVGYRLEDPDLRRIFIEISEQDIIRPRSYVVTPTPNPRDVRLWQQKKIETLSGTFQEFLTSLAEKIPSALREIVTQEKQHPIETKFVVHQHLSPSALTFLSNDVLYITNNIVSDEVNAGAFYRGYSSGWSCIESKLDASRQLTDQLLSDYFIRDEADDSISTELYVIKGYAGSGKSVLLKRLAWDATFEFNRICIFLKNDGHLKFEPLNELCELTNERIFIFIDRPSIRSAEIENIINLGRKRKLKLTFICAERTNEWNIECTKLATLVDETYELRGLSEKEINNLIDKLKENSSLGALSGMSRESQVKTFSEYANRQLLVALYEVTSGKPFEEIVLSEYQNIYPEEAQRMYLIICSLNRLQVPVRAGIIKRLTNISFNEFSTKFFGPLESIVFTEEYKPALDMAYRTRHPWIAETIFERALPDPNERYDLYIELIGVLDTGYQPDRIAYREIIKAKNLMNDFGDYLKISSIYKLSKERFPDDAYLLQQEGIFEMKRDNGSLNQAYSLLTQAKQMAPYDKSILHSLSELELQRANRSTTSLEKEKHFRAAKNIAQTLLSENGDSSHAFATIAKVGIEKLSEMIASEKVEDASFTALIKEVEKNLQDGLQKFPDDEYLHSIEASFFLIIEKQDKAILALEKANKANQASPYIARSLSRIYMSQGKIDQAKTVLTQCLDINPSDKPVNAAFAQLLTNNFPDENEKAELHWRRAFTEGDSNFFSQYWYARQLFINKKFKESEDAFKRLKLVRADPKVKLEVRGLLLDISGKPRLFSGEITSLEASYFWMKVKNESFNVYCHKSKIDENLWQKLNINSQLNFTLGFNYYGLAVCEVQNISN